MSHNQFRALLDRFGSNLSKWPCEDQSAARALLGRSAEARRLLDEAQDLDKHLAVPEPRLSDAKRRALVDGIMDRLDDEDNRHETRSHDRSLALVSVSGTVTRTHRAGRLSSVRDWSLSSACLPSVSLPGLMLGTLLLAAMSLLVGPLMGMS